MADRRRYRDDPFSPVGDSPHHHSSRGDHYPLRSDPYSPRGGYPRRFSPPSRRATGGEEHFDRRQPRDRFDREGPRYSPRDGRDGRARFEPRLDPRGDPQPDIRGAPSDPRNEARYRRSGRAETFANHGPDAAGRDRLRRMPSSEGLRRANTARSSGRFEDHPPRGRERPPVTRAHPPPKRRNSMPAGATKFLSNMANNPAVRDTIQRGAMGFINSYMHSNKQKSMQERVIEAGRNAFKTGYTGHR